MNLWDRLGTASDGEARGQTEVLGIAFAFALVVFLIGLNQAFVVPQDNAEVEFQHSQEVRNDVVDLRGGIVEAASSNERQAVPVRFGTEYPGRLVAVNPPPVAGRLRTVGGGEVSVDGVNMTEVCGTDDQPDTQFLEYDANYNEFEGGPPITVENSVTHREGDGDRRLDTGQVVVRGNVIEVTRLVGDYRRTTVRTETVELVPAATTGIDTIQGVNRDSPVSVTFPTRLGEDDWDRLTDDGRVNDVDVSGDEVTLELDAPSASEEYVVRCTTVGIEQEPDVSPERSPPLTGDPTTIINPWGPDTLELFTVEDGDGSTDVNATFVNRYDGEINVTEARVSYVNAPGFSEGDTVTMTFGAASEVDLVVGGDFKAIDDGTVDSEAFESARFDDAPSGPNVGFGLELRVREPGQDEDEEPVTYKYFVSVEG